MDVPPPIAANFQKSGVRHTRLCGPDIVFDLPARSSIGFVFIGANLSWPREAMVWGLAVPRSRLRNGAPPGNGPDLTVAKLTFSAIGGPPVEPGTGPHPSADVKNAGEEVKRDRLEACPT